RRRLYRAAASTFSAGGAHAAEGRALAHRLRPGAHQRGRGSESSRHRRDQVHLHLATAAGAERSRMFRLAGQTVASCDLPWLIGCRVLSLDVANVLTARNHAELVGVARWAEIYPAIFRTLFLTCLADAGRQWSALDRIAVLLTSAKRKERHCCEEDFHES